jgi:hypothetical protein
MSVSLQSTAKQDRDITDQKTSLVGPGLCDKWLGIVLLELCFVCWLKSYLISTVKRDTQISHCPFAAAVIITDLQTEEELRKPVMSAEPASRVSGRLRRRDVLWTTLSTDHLVCRLQRKMPSQGKL